MSENESTEKKNTFIQLITKRIALSALIGTIAGAAGGFAYYYFIGCSSGTCPITSSPYVSILWGGLMGYLLGDMFVKKNTTKES
jgi:hypothetical protein